MNRIHVSPQIQKSKHPTPNLKAEKKYFERYIESCITLNLPHVLRFWRILKIVKNSFYIILLVQNFRRSIIFTFPNVFPYMTMLKKLTFNFLWLQISRVMLTCVWKQLYRFKSIWVNCTCTRYSVHSPGFLLTQLLHKRNKILTSMHQNI